MATEIAKWIKESRETANITQAQLAEKIGVTQPYVSQWEHGTSRPSQSIIEKISAVLGAEVPSVSAEFDLKTWLVKRRNELNLSRKQLAEKAGISDLTVYFIETGKTESPQQDTLQRLEKVLGKLPSELSEEIEEESKIEDFKYFGPFPLDEWEENVEGKVGCIYVIYDSLKRPVRIGETDDLRRRMIEYKRDVWWLRSPTAESFAYVTAKDSSFRRKAEKVMIKLVGDHAIFNIQERI